MKVLNLKTMARFKTKLAAQGSPALRESLQNFLAALDTSDYQQLRELLSTSLKPEIEKFEGDLEQQSYVGQVITEPHD